MEELLAKITSVQALVVVVGLNLIFQMVKFLFGLLKNDKKATDETVNKLTAEVAKLRKDLQRFYSAVKLIAGDRWSEVSEKIQKDDEFFK